MWGLIFHRKAQKKSADQCLSTHNPPLSGMEMEFKLFWQWNGATNACSNLNMWWISMPEEQLCEFCWRNSYSVWLYPVTTPAKAETPITVVRICIVPPEWRLFNLLKQVDLCVHAHTQTQHSNLFLPCNSTLSVSRFKHLFTSKENKENILQHSCQFLKEPQIVKLRQMIKVMKTKI